MADYRQQAINSYDPSYNAKLQALKAALNNQLASLSGQKNNINQTYDQQAETQNRNSGLAKNNFDNNTTSRGLGRSTIFTTGMAGLDQENNRLLGQLNQSRTNAIGEVDAQTTALNNNYESQVAQMTADRESVLADLIRQYQQQDIDNSFRERQLQASIASAASRGSSSKEEDETLDPIIAAKVMFDKHMEAGDLEEWWNLHKLEIMHDMGDYDAFRSLQKEYLSWKKQKNNENPFAVE